MKLSHIEYGGVAPPIRSLIVWRYMGRFMPRPQYPRKKRLHFPLNRTLAGTEILDVLESGCYCYQVETELFTDENARQTL
jgi:hypothetical protein